MEQKISVKDFLSFPSPSKLQSFGRDLSSSIKRELGSDIQDVDTTVYTLVRICTIVTENDIKSQQIVCHCTDEILQEVFKSGDDNTGSLVANAYLVYMGILKGEDKKYKPPADITGPLIVLEHIVKQSYFPRAAKKIISAFMDKPHPMLSKSTAIRSKLLSTLYAST